MRATDSIMALIMALIMNLIMSVTLIMSLIMSVTSILFQVIPRRSPCDPRAVVVDGWTHVAR